MDQPPLSIARITFRRSFETAVKDDLDLPGIFHGLVNGLVDIDPVFGAGRHHVPEPFQGLADLGLGQGAILGIILIAPLHGHLDGRLVPRHAPHPHAPRGGSRNGPPAKFRRCRSICFPRDVPRSVPLSRSRKYWSSSSGRQFFQFLFIDAQGIGQVLRVFQPFFQQGAGHVRQARTPRLP